jgi:hypothetical protein
MRNPAHEKCPGQNPALRWITASVSLCARCATRVAAALNARLFTGRVHGPGRVFHGASRFQKYRVAPRLGTDTVRRRILLRLRNQTALAIIEIHTA